MLDHLALNVLSNCSKLFVAKCIEVEKVLLVLYDRALSRSNQRA